MLSQQFHSYTCRCHYGANLMSVTNLKHLICTELNLFNMTLMNWSHSPLRFFFFFTKLHLHYSWSCLRSCLTLIMYPFTFSDLYRNHMILMIALYTQKKKKSWYEQPVKCASHVLRMYFVRSINIQRLMIFFHCFHNTSLPHILFGYWTRSVYALKVKPVFIVSFGMLL